MDGVREFLNNTCSDLNVIISVRAGDKIGCVFRIEEFCLKRFECLKIIFGNEINPFIDGIKVCYCDYGQFAATELVVKKYGCTVDKLLNKHFRIIFLDAGPTIAISAQKI
jgi:hypothetical protein